jgi:pimeloyl-ACP methyl ester carboxylesterase
MRLEKRGVGDSEGEGCEGAGFDGEVEDVKAALCALAGYAFVDARAIFAFGHSVGGMVAPLLEPLGLVSGYIALGTSAARWLDCVEASTRRQALLRGASPAESERAARSEREAIERAIQDPGSRALVGGRGAAFHRELQATDLANAWAEVSRPVLVLRGELDWVVSEEEQAAIARIVNDRRPGLAETQKINGIDHLMARHESLAESLRSYGHGAFDPAVTEAASAFVRRVLEARKKIKRGGLKSGRMSSPRASPRRPGSIKESPAMPHLRPCPQCSRHVRSDEARCPFCDSDCSVGASDRGPAAPSPSTRLGRAALMAFGTAVVAATTAASCGGTQGSDPQADGRLDRAGRGLGRGSPAAAAAAPGRSSAPRWGR